MSAEETSWRTPNFRQSVVAKIEEAIRSSGMPTTKNSMEMENHVFQKAKTKEEYLGFVARLILHVREMNSKKNPALGGPAGGAGQNMQNPIDALQTLARQGSGNQMMGLVPPQGPAPVTATNLLQTLNQRPNNQQRMQSPVQGNVIGQMGNQMGSMGGPMGGPMQSQMSMGGPMGGPMGPMGGQMGPMGPMAGQMGSPISGQISHMQQRKGAEMIGQNYGGPRNVAPNQFLQQSPTPPTQSPAGMPTSNQMVASPALVPSPGNPGMTSGGMGSSLRSVGMAPSPSSSLNTPGQPVPTPSPHSQTEEQAYQAKVRQLSKYIEPLRRVIARVGNEDGQMEKVSKMKKLLEILSTPGKRVPLETLLKCEVVLEKLDLKRGDGSGPTLREQHPLLEALQTHLQSPVLNHTLQRTFGPCLEALFGSDIKMLPPPLKKKKLEEPVDDIPEVLQGEIARLDQRFKVSLDPTQQTGSRCVQLLCVLDDRHLPCVPPVSLSVPEDYPHSPPLCHLAPHEYSATKFLSAVQAALESRVRKLPGRFSVSQLLDTWEMSVRQACAPTQSPTPAAPALLMGL
ncbi:mediator of RNA polymerase II transcription subunit 15-like [Macrosteles quadrilineatus]|uniref:mediator of RNA polymerase II transcription subunit 15-like n=1 Tax=Macrosteles quadrilineatus TaxID=74068 RepID=UPI0023E2C653|nr:mediator of RNA polymerase II transcription subunit 15-like [Macrosteles quadrilineatus]XP_054282872.1 mediator of RNA polymerase II transcription subunit 15-like [Macrosteles quadrilineatus]